MSTKNYTFHIFTIKSNIKFYRIPFPTSILFNSGSTVTSIVRKHKLPPITLDTGSARNTPWVPIFNAYGSKYVSGTTMKTLRNREKKTACFFLFKDLNTVCPIYCKSMKINAAKYVFNAGIASFISSLSELNTPIR